MGGNVPVLRLDYKSMRHFQTLYPNLQKRYFFFKLSTAL